MSDNPLEQELKSVLEEIQNKNTEGGKIIAAWNKIAESFVEHAKPGALNKRVLYIDVDDSDWMYVCSLKIEQIKEGLADFFKQGIIEEIKFRVGR
ncbi:MAG: DciA family protein [Candidatus Kaelpia aquatica]|nr:DciA family protein [Candidatus Kaelpia aquatica]